MLSVAMMGTAALGASSASGAPTPTIKQVQKQVDKLQNQVDQATEQYDQTRDRMKSMSVRLAAAKKQMQAQQVQIQRARRQVGLLASETYRRGQLSILDLVLSDNPDSILAQAGYLPSLDDRQAAAMETLKQGEQNLLNTEALIKSQQRDAKAAQAKLRSSRSTIRKKLAAATAEINKLQGPARAALDAANQARNNAGLPSGGASAACASGEANASSSAARTAITFACNQLGEPYHYGSYGPSEWDCSGLTMESYAAAGITLPHSAEEQAGYGTRVSTSALLPGDLIFFDSPIGHVGIYLGAGLMIHAPHTGDVVRVASVYANPVAAVRLS